MDKTVKQIADDYRTSKQSIQYHIKKMPKSYWYFDIKDGIKTVMVNEDGQDYIYAKMTKKITDNSIKLATKNDYLELKHKLNMKELENKNYLERLEILKQQNEEQRQRIDTLLKLVDQAQQLQAIAENKIKLLEQHDQHLSEQVVSRSNSEDHPEVKKGFFARLLGK